MSYNDYPEDTAVAAEPQDGRVDLMRGWVDLDTEIKNLDRKIADAEKRRAKARETQEAFTRKVTETVLGNETINKKADW